MLLAKYTDNGSSATLGWTQVGGGTEEDSGFGIAVSGPRVYITGYSNNNTTNTRGVLFGARVPHPAQYRSVGLPLQQARICC
ncbi:MAG: hypothetical protein EOO60_05460 [Hymenobacter sp.]|nr:MAG: hypothetical protein EOO60_05460 [Hymenobacter sp.]